jgi:hypothetical protein
LKLSRYSSIDTQNSIISFNSWSQSNDTITMLGSKTCENFHGRFCSTHL